MQPSKMVHTVISKKASSTPTTEKPPAQSSSKSKPIIIIEACQGPDCFGSGGGAVLLELEDLVQEYHDETTSGSDDGQCFRVVAGGCRNFCSMGPNVHVSGGRHFESVKEIEACRKVANDIDLLCRIIPSKDDDSSSTTTSSVISKMLWKRAHRLRWQALRDLARFKKNKAANPEVMRGQLQEVRRAELAAAAKSNDPEATTVRTQRRHQRLETELRQIVLRRAEESSDDDESDDDESSDDEDASS